MTTTFRKWLGLPWLNLTVLGIVLAVAMGAILISFLETKPSGPPAVEIASAPTQDPPGSGDDDDDDTDFEVNQEVSVLSGPPISGPLPGPAPVLPRPDTPFYVFDCPHLNATVKGGQTFGSQHKLGIEAKIQQLFPQYVPALKSIASKHADRDSYLLQHNERLRSPGFYWWVRASRIVVENGSAFVYLRASRGTDNPVLARTGDIVDASIYEKWKLDPITEPPTLVTRSLDLAPLWQELQIIRY